MNVPILEFDPSREALLNPSRVYEPRPDMPASCVLCFFHDVIDQLLYSGDDLGSAEWDGRDWHGQWTAREKLTMLASELALEL